MNANAKFVKAVILLAIFTAASVPLTCYADSETDDPGSTENTANVESPENTQSSNPGITLRDDAPIYAGPVEDGDLEPLTQADFEAFGADPDSPEDQYLQYQKTLQRPAPGILVPYKMKIESSDLAVDDFFGFNVSEDLSRARYESFLNMTPVVIDGRTVQYVFVYHSPLDRIEAEASANLS